MAIAVTGIDTSSETVTFNDFFALANTLANIITNYTLTANSDAGGSLVTGNSFVIGILGSTILTANTLHGGNVDTFTALTMTSNLVFDATSVLISGILTSNATEINFGTILNANSTRVTVGNTVINTTSLAHGNLIVNTSTLIFGNTVINSSVFTHGGLSLNTSTLTLGNVTINDSVLDVGVGGFRVNGSVGTNGQILYSNGSAAYFGDPGSISLGGGNTQVQFNNSNAFGGSAAFTFNKSSNTLTVENFTVGISSANSTALKSGNVVINTIALAIGNTIANASSISANLFTGAGVQATANQLWAGNTGIVLTADKVKNSSAFQTLTYGANIAINGLLGINFKCTLTGNGNIDNMTNIVEGRSGIIQLKQDGSGNRVPTYGSCYIFDSNTAPSINTTANKSTWLSYLCANTTNVIIGVYAAGTY